MLCYVLIQPGLADISIILQFVTFNGFNCTEMFGKTGGTYFSAFGVAHIATVTQQ